MIGVYDYTVILTYLSMVSGATGIILSMTGIGHPYIGTLFLLVCGLLDGIDGRVARTKKGRSEFEKGFGEQIDSLSDLVCFGVLPAAIGIAQLRISGRFTEIIRGLHQEEHVVSVILMIAVAIFYILAALIRLAYFNVTTVERKTAAAKEGTEYYTGLPVTSAALIFPMTLIIHFFSRGDLTVVYFFIMFFLALLFIVNFKVSKPGKKGLAALIVLGVFEMAATIVIISVSW